MASDGGKSTWPPSDASATAEPQRSRASAETPKPVPGPSTASVWCGSPVAGPPRWARSSSPIRGAAQARASKSLISWIGPTPRLASSPSDTRHGELVRSMKPSVTGPATAITPPFGRSSHPSRKARTPSRKVGWASAGKLSWCSTRGTPSTMRDRAKRALVPPTSPTRCRGAGLIQASMVRSTTLGSGGVSVPGGPAGGWAKQMEAPCSAELTASRKAPNSSRP